MEVTVDFPGQYNFLQDIAITDQCPALSSGVPPPSIHLVELTAPFETNIPNAAER